MISATTKLGNVPNSNGENSAPKGQERIQANPSCPPQEKRIGTCASVAAIVPKSTIGPVKYPRGSKVDCKRYQLTSPASDNILSKVPKTGPGKSPRAPLQHLKRGPAKGASSFSKAWKFPKTGTRKLFQALVNNLFCCFFGMVLFSITSGYCRLFVMILFGIISGYIHFIGLLLIGIICGYTRLAW